MPKRELMTVERPVKIAFLQGLDADGTGGEAAADGDDVGALTKLIFDDTDVAMDDRAAYLDFDLVEVQGSVSRFVDGVQERDYTVVQLISHADAGGYSEVADVWGAFELDPENLARALRGCGVRVVLVTTCFGTAIAEALMKHDACDVAIGFPDPQPFGMARAFSRGFYRSLFHGRTIREAFEDGKGQAAVRFGATIDRMVICEREDGCADRALFAPPVYYFIGSPSERHKATFDRLKAALAAHRPTFHASDKLFGDAGEDLMTTRLEMCQVVMVLFEGQRIRDKDLLNQIAAAIEQAQHRGVRCFPVYLEGTRPHRRLPLGLKRLHPAYIENELSPEALAERIKPLVK